MKMKKSPGSNLLVGLVMGTLTMAPLVSTGCSGSADQPQDHQKDVAAVQPAAQMAAGQASNALLGVQRWEVFDVAEGFRVDGVDRDGAVLQQVFIHQFVNQSAQDGNTRSEDGWELATSSGGLLRVTLAGHVLKRIDDPQVFSSFATDVNNALKSRDGMIPYSCNFWQWLGCAGAVIGAIAVCEEASAACLAAVLGTGVCFDCALSHSGGGGGGGVTCFTTYDEYGGSVTTCW